MRWIGSEYFLRQKMWTDRQSVSQSDKSDMANNGLIV